MDSRVKHGNDKKNEHGNDWRGNVSRHCASFNYSG